MLNIPCVQMIDAGVAAAPDDEAVRLSAPDVPQMLDSADAHPWRPVR